jgi:DNA-binding MarR family transcriptional regulator
MSPENVMSEKVREHRSHVDFGPASYPADANGCKYDPRIRELLNRSGRKPNAGTEALAAVRILGKKMHMMMEHWADEHGLSEGRFQILVRLQQNADGRMTMGVLAEMLDVTPRSVTGLVDNLERDGLVRRVDDPRDRRSIYAEITDEGRARVKALWHDAAVGQGALTRNFKESEMVQLRDICLRLIEAMSGEEGKNHATG